MVVCVLYIGLIDTCAQHDAKVAGALCAWWLQGLIISFIPTAFIGSLNGFVSTWASIVLCGYFLALSVVEVSSERRRTPSSHLRFTPAAHACCSHCCSHLRFTHTCRAERASRP